MLGTEFSTLPSHPLRHLEVNKVPYYSVNQNNLHLSPGQPGSQGAYRLLREGTLVTLRITLNLHIRKLQERLDGSAVKSWDWQWGLNQGLLRSVSKTLALTLI